MKTKNKPHYGLWRNTGFMVALAWKECKSVLVITLALALTMTAKSVVQLLVAPAILGEVEAAAPVPEISSAGRSAASASRKSLFAIRLPPLSFF